MKRPQISCKNPKLHKWWRIWVQKKNRINFKLARAVGRKNLTKTKKFLLRFTLCWKWRCDNTNVGWFWWRIESESDKEEKRDNVTSLIKILWSTALSKKLFVVFSPFLSEGFQHLLSINRRLVWGRTKREKRFNAWMNDDDDKL